MIDAGNMGISENVTPFSSSGFSLAPRILVIFLTHTSSLPLNPITGAAIVPLGPRLPAMLC